LSKEQGKREKNNKKIEKGGEGSTPSSRVGGKKRGEKVILSIPRAKGGRGKKGGGRRGKRNREKHPALIILIIFGKEDPLSNLGKKRK